MVAIRVVLHVVPLGAGLMSVAAAACLPSITFSGGGDAGGEGGPGAEGGAPLDGSLDGSDASLDAGADGATDATSSGDGPITPASIGVGMSASCALMADGTVQCWGSNALASLGADGSPDAFAYTPQPVPGLTHVLSLGVGSGHSCVALEGGVVECWGSDGEGELGMAGPDEDVPTPIQSLQFEDGGTIATVAAGDAHTCAIAADGVTLWCWGYYAGTSSTTSSMVPVYLATLPARAVALAAGALVTCELDVNDAVWCWGQNNQDALGQGSAVALGASVLTPVRVAVGAPVAQLAVAAEHACVVTTSHDLLCWGDDTLGQLGPITVPDPDAGPYVPSPTSVPIAPGHVSKVGCGDNHTCALFDDGGIQCWGYNYDGELGVTEPPNGYLYPIAVPGLGPATDLFVHFESACAKLVGGGVACWGNDASGQLGAGVLPAMPIGAQPVTFP
jgi:alpha-tubulin suppressor-like RCC1 family protein